MFNRLAIILLAVLGVYAQNAPPTHANLTFGYLIFPKFLSLDVFGSYEILRTVTSQCQLVSLTAHSTFL